MSILMWTVYERPPGESEPYVARLWSVEPGHAAPRTETLAANSLADLRQRLVERGFVRVNRLTEDAPGIVENWV